MSRYPVGKERDDLIEALVADMRQDCSLAESAARAAATILAQNWVDAMQDGTRLRALLDDVDDVVRLLQSWKDLVKDGIGVRFQVEVPK